MEYTINYRNIIRGYNNFDCHVNTWLCFALARSDRCFEFNLRVFTGKNKCWNVRLLSTTCIHSKKPPNVLLRTGIAQSVQSLHSVQTSCGVPPVSYSWGNMGTFSDGKVAGA
jgi:hypothetical protein